MTRAKLVDMLRRSRAILDAILGLEGYEARSYVEAVRESGEELAAEIHSALDSERDLGGPRVRSALGDEFDPSIRSDLDARLAEFEAEHDRPLRVPPNPSTAKVDLRRSVLDSILYSVAAGDDRLAALLSALLVDLDEQGRTR